MKNLVVYYSRTTNTEIVAKEIAKAVDGDMRRIELKKGISFFWAGFTSAMGKQGKIKPFDYDLKGYDNVFIGSPVWAGKTSTPINTFLSNADFTGKNVYIFITQADNKTPSLVYESISKRVEEKGGKVADTFFVKTDMKNPVTAEQARKHVEEWIKRII